ncbi:MAG: glycosyltransferase [Acidobacteria bacterium]|nr:glycosyltransferase [Acidobacteriota bacterium]
MFDTTAYEFSEHQTPYLPTGRPQPVVDLPLTTFSQKAAVTSIAGRSMTDIEPKILLYSHDTFGLGNIRRTLLLAQSLIDQYPAASVLIITGSPVIHAFRLPRGVDYIKLPSLDRVGAERYEPLTLTNCPDEIIHTRAALIAQIVAGFAPDLFIVDKRAAGINGELLKALKTLKQNGSRTKIVLGLRDILDAPERTARVLRENGSFATIENFYDEVWIYGSREIFDTAKEYEFPLGVKRITRYCGYLKRPVHKSTPGNGALRVLVTTGGGGDGAAMIETYLESLPLLEAELAVSSTVVFGPQLQIAKREILLARFGRISNVEFLDFEADLTKLYSRADVVISMAGYNTVCELLSHQKSAVLVPRSEPVREQLIRARLLAQQGLFETIEPAELNPETMKAKIIAAVKTSSPKRRLLDLDGLPRINERVRYLLSNEFGQS